jgi:hypothetical protein
MPRTRRQTTTGDELEGQLRQAIRDVDRAPLPGARDLPVLTGIDRRGDFVDPQENVLMRAAEILLKSRRVFTYGNTAVMQIAGLEGTGDTLVPLRTGPIIEKGAPSLLANLFVCRFGGKEFPPPAWFVPVLLHADSVLPLLPRIALYARRPVFDSNFHLRGPGWHADVGIMVHGPIIEPINHEPAESASTTMERLPPHLRALLQGFCFRSDVDVVNTVAILLTGILINRFIVTLKPVVLVDGNQPGLGKTMLVRVFGIVLDNVDPRLTHFTTDEEELQKRLCATLREARQTILLIDNAKTPGGSIVSSPTIEANSMAPEISLRILGKSANLNRPNDILWFLTMNDTRASPDLVSRSVPIQLAYEGRPENRVFAGEDPIEYARSKRVAIVGELSGMITRWNQQGRPPGNRSHRLHAWAHIIGGILETAGLSGFLENAETAAASFNPAMDDLAALAEATIHADKLIGIAGELSGGITKKRLAREWETLFKKADVSQVELSACKSSQGRAIKIGRFFSPLINREVTITCDGRAARATLRVEQCRAREKLYYFEIEFEDSTVPADSDKTTKVATAEKRTEPNQTPGPKPAKTTEPKTSPRAVDNVPNLDPRGNKEEW